MGLIVKGSLLEKKEIAFQVKYKEIEIKEPYELSGEQYQILIKTTNWLSRWSSNLFICSVILLLPLISKGFQYVVSQKYLEFELWEIFAPGAAFILGLILKLISYKWPDDRTKLLKEIGQYFKSVPKKKAIIKND